VKKQPLVNKDQVDPTKYKNIVGFMDQINSRIVVAQNHATYYEDTVFPAAQKTITNIQSYYQLHQLVPSVLPKGSTTQEWIKMLGQLKDQAGAFQVEAKNMSGDLGDLRNKLEADVADFADIVNKLNTAVNGDKGVLKDINNQLSDLQGKIAGAIAGITLSAIAILAGVFVCLVGAVAGFVTGGTSTVVVLGGAAIIAAGIGGEVASALMLKGMQDAQADLTRTRETLTSEVKFATTLSTNYGSLSQQMSAAADAAEAMKGSWDFLSDGLDDLSNKLQKGIVSSDGVQQLWLASSNAAVNNVVTDATNIINNLATRQNLVAPTGQTIGDFAVETANKYAKAA
jgi:superoxide dismutase